jgi:hypothetical protein
MWRNEVVTSTPRPAIFSSIAPASSRTWLTPIPLLYRFASRIPRPELGLPTAADHPEPRGARRDVVTSQAGPDTAACHYQGGHNALAQALMTCYWDVNSSTVMTGVGRPEYGYFAGRVGQDRRSEGV